MLSHVIRVQRANKEVYRLAPPSAAAGPTAEDIGLAVGTVVDGGFPWCWWTRNAVDRFAEEQAAASDARTVGEERSDSKKPAEVPSLIERMDGAADAVLPENEDVGGPAPGLQVGSPVGALTVSSSPAVLRSDSEMDVGEHGDVPRERMLATVDLPGDGSSGKSTPSTLADESVPITGAGRSPLPSRKRARSVSDSDDERRSGTRPPRMGATSGPKRGQARSRAR